MLACGVHAERRVIRHGDDAPDPGGVRRGEQVLRALDVDA
jgi:hypothetical protein